MLWTPARGGVSVPPSRGLAARAGRVEAAGITLRDYQQARVTQALGLFERHRSVLFTMATGTGKGRCATAVADHFGGALFLAHREFLLDQLADNMAEYTRDMIVYEKAERKAEGGRYICGSVQTLKGERLKFFAAKFADLRLIVVDEAHRAAAKTYREVFAAFPEAKVIGFTATPDRSDQVALGHVFDAAVDPYDARTAVGDAWLTPFSVHPVTVDVDLSGMKVSAGDFDAGQLDEAMAREVAKIARAAVELAGEWKSVIFTPGVKTAHLVADAINEIKPDSAAAVDGKMDEPTKRSRLRRHKKGELQYIANCGVLTEGYDDPRLVCMIDAAPTKSRLRWAQKGGRIMRLWPGVDAEQEIEARRAAIAASPKPWGRILDLVCNAGKHSLAGPADLLGGLYSPEERDAAARILREAGGKVEDALEAGRAAVAEEKARQAAMAKRAAQAKATAKLGPEVDPWGAYGVKNPARSIRIDDYPTEKMLRYLGWAKIKYPRDADGMPLISRQQAGKLIAANKFQEKMGWCSLAQIEWLGRFGIKARTMRAAVGKEIAVEYLENGRRMPSKARIAEIAGFVRAA